MFMLSIGHRKSSEQRQQAIYPKIYLLNSDLFSIQNSNVMKIMLPDFS